MKKILALSMADFRNVIRDSTLILIFGGTVMLWALLRLVVPLVSVLVQDRFNFILANYFDLIVSFLSLIPAMLFGLLSGFIMLDERDEEIISYMAVTPLRKTGYLTYKILAPMVVTFIFFFILIYTINLVSLPLKYAPGLAFLISFEAPMTALFLVAFAGNKVEGMALSKVLGMMYIAPFIAYFVNSPWQFLAGIFPPFWVTKAFLAAFRNNSFYWLYLIPGLFTHLAYIWFFMNRFLKTQR